VPDNPFSRLPEAPLPNIDLSADLHYAHAITHCKSLGLSELIRQAYCIAPLQDIESFTLHLITALAAFLLERELAAPGSQAPTDDLQSKKSELQQHERKTCHGRLMQATIRPTEQNTQCTMTTTRGASDEIM